MLESDAKLLHELLSLIAHPDAETASAAALVIGSLKPDPGVVIPALESAIASAPHHVVPYVVDALAQYSDTRVRQRLINLLESGGTQREQATTLLERLGAEALPELQRAWQEKGFEHRGALIRILCTIPKAPALDLVFEYLSTASFEQSRQCYLQLKPRLQNWSDELRTRAFNQSIALLTHSSSEQVGVKAAALRLLGQMGHEASLQTLLNYADPTRDIVLRFAALESLRTFPIPPTHQAQVVAALIPVLEEACDPALRAIAFRTLREFTPTPFTPELLAGLSSSEHPDIAKLALRELPKFPGTQTLDLLMDALHRSEPAVQSAAVAALGQLEGATESLIAASQDPRFSERADLLRAVLDAHGPRLSSDDFQRHFSTLLSDLSLNFEQLVPRILALSALNRDRTNQGLEQRAADSLKAQEPEKAMQWLEPLVKHRLATPKGRYLLAKAHLLTAHYNSGPSDPHWIRAFQLLGPLGRLHEFHLLELLRDDFSDNPDLLQRVIQTWSLKSEREKTWAEWLRSRTSRNGDQEPRP